MNFPKSIAAGALVCSLAAVGVAQRQGDVVREKGGEDETGPYDVVPNWPQPLHADRTWGRAAGRNPRKAAKSAVQKTR